MSITFNSILSQEMNDYLNLLHSAKRDTNSYVSTFKSLDNYLVKVKVTEKALSEELLLNWFSTLSIAETTRNYEIARMRKFTRYLNALNIPAFELDFFRAKSTFKAYTFTDEEFARIITVADSGKASYTNTESAFVFPLLLRVLYGCGLRVGEALALQWKDVDLYNGILTIKKAKNNKQRRIPVSNSLKSLLAQYYKRRFTGSDDSMFLFVNSEKTGKPYDSQTFGYWFSKVLEKAGIDNPRKTPFERCISTNTLRHYFTFLSFQKAVAEGRALEETAPYLSAYLGHETFFGTEKYLTTDYTMYTDSQERVSKAIQSVFPEVYFE